MSAPLPLPSKAAIRALRGIALGTSCAIGIIVEHRRRRINTLRAAVANKQKLKSSRQYHYCGLEELVWQLDGAVAVGHNAPWYRWDGHEVGTRRDSEGPDSLALSTPDLGNHATFMSSLEEENEPTYRRTPQHLLQQPRRFFHHTSIVTKSHLLIPTSGRPPDNAWTAKVADTHPVDPWAALDYSQEPLIQSIEDLLIGADKEQLDQAVFLFVSHCPTIRTSPLLDRWMEISVQLSKECQAKDRWDDAGQILKTIIKSGPLDEARYFCYNPSSIIEFYLRQPDPDAPCSIDNILSAAKLFLAELQDKSQARGKHMEHLGRRLLLIVVSSQRFILARNIYWRILGWAEDPEEVVRWAIRVFHEHEDHKLVVKIFLLHYSRMKLSITGFNETMDMIVDSVQILQGLTAIQILDGFAQMEAPGDHKLRTRWIMKLLQAHWERYKDLSQTVILFEHAVTLGLLEKVSHPQGIYSGIVEMAVRADDEGMAHAYAERLLHEHPDMMNDIALRLVLFRAKVGDWNGVLEILSHVRPSELAVPTAYEGTLILVLGIFAESHTATETRDFAMQYPQEADVGFHPYIVTLVAKKFGEARDMAGFIAWLELSIQEGFVLNAGFCNTVLHNCSTVWKMSFPQLQLVHAKFEALSPHYSDRVTQRIMSQAAHREGRAPNRVTLRAPATSKLASSGRSTNNRDIYDAMNQKLVEGKPMAAVKIYERAIHYGMPFCSHCLRLAVLAMLRGKDSDLGAGLALGMIQKAYAQGHDVDHAISVFIKCRIDTFRGENQDLVSYMRNLISRFESSRIVIGSDVLTHMAVSCVKIGQPEKAIALCNLARNRTGAPHLCFSKQSFKALASAYWQLSDVSGMNSLIDDMCRSEFSADKLLLLHLKSIRRLAKKTSSAVMSTGLPEAIERGIQHITRNRTKTLTQGKLVSQTALQIVGNALADMQNSKSDEHTRQHHIDKAEVERIIAADRLIHLAPTG